MNGAEYIMLGCLLILSIMDLRTRKISLLPVLLLGLFAMGYRFWENESLWEVLTGMLPGGVLLLAAWVTKESIGYGDGIVLLVVGVFCGIKKTVAILGISLILAAVMAMLLLVLRRAGRKTELPFLPCLCSGYLLCLLW